MDVRRLLIFRSVAATGSIAAAARELGWTQPAVSQHLRQLEREVGTPLVVRQSRGVALTEAGRVALDHADAIAARMRTAADELGALADLSRGTVRLAAFPSASAVLVSQALARISTRHPGLALRSYRHPEVVVRPAQAAGSRDLAVVHYPDGDRTPGVAAVLAGLGAVG